MWLSASTLLFLLSLVIDVKGKLLVCERMQAQEHPVESFTKDILEAKLQSIEAKIKRNFLLEKYMLSKSGLNRIFQSQYTESFYPNEPETTLVFRDYILLDEKISGFRHTKEWCFVETSERSDKLMRLDKMMKSVNISLKPSKEYRSNPPKASGMEIFISILCVMILIVVCTAGTVEPDIKQRPQDDYGTVKNTEISDKSEIEESDDDSDSDDDSGEETAVELESEDDTQDETESEPEEQLSDSFEMIEI